MTDDVRHIADGLRFNMDEAEVAALAETDTRHLLGSASEHDRAMGRLYETGYRSAWLRWRCGEPAEMQAATLPHVLAHQVAELCAGCRDERDAHLVAASLLAEITRCTLLQLDINLAAVRLRRRGDA